MSGHNGQIKFRIMYVNNRLPNNGVQLQVIAGQQLQVVNYL